MIKNFSLFLIASIIGLLSFQYIFAYELTNREVNIAESIASKIQIRHPNDISKYIWILNWLKLEFNDERMFVFINTIITILNGWSEGPINVSKGNNSNSKEWISCRKEIVVSMDNTGAPMFFSYYIDSYSSDGSSYGYIINKGNHNDVLYFNWVEYWSYQNIVNNKIAISPNWEHIAFIISDDNQYKLIVDWVKQKLDDDLIIHSDSIFYHDDWNLFYAGEWHGQKVLFINNKSIWVINTTSISKERFYQSDINEGYLYLDWLKTYCIWGCPLFNFIEDEEQVEMLWWVNAYPIERLDLSEDGKHISYLKKEGGLYRDDYLIDDWSVLDIIISPDWEKTIYKKKENGRFFWYANGLKMWKDNDPVAMTEWYKPYKTPVFSNNSRIWYISNVDYNRNKLWIIIDEHVIVSGKPAWEIVWLYPINNNFMYILKDGNNTYSFYSENWTLLISEHFDRFTNIGLLNENHWIAGFWYDQNSISYIVCK